MSTPDQKPPSSPAPARGRSAGEYGEGGAHEATGVGPRNPDTPQQKLNDQPGPPDTYGNVEPGRYGVHGYSGSRGHVQAHAAEAGASRDAPCAHHSPPGASDDQLRELIRQRLTEDPALDASDISVEVSDGRVTLAGTVASARARSEIEQTVENCGALEVDNQLRALA